MLKSALARYLKIQENGGWPTIPGGKAIKPGKEDKRIMMLRFRLAAEGDLPYAPGQNVYDEVLEHGVKVYQERNHLKADGVIGPATLKVMNIPVEHRIQQIRADLDRERWYFPRDIDEYLLVDVADFRVYWMKQHEVFWESLVQVGKSYTTTPIFRDQIEHIDFNPTWSVPPSIKKLNILPSLQIDSSYLDKKGYQLLDDYGNKVDPRDIDWDDVKDMNFTVRQPPGWGNALGKVKFMFPNKHSVFLHDTNQRNKFAKKKRTTSHGCIRLKNPFDFAELLLKHKEGWDRQRIDNLVASNRTTSVKLDKPLPILIKYSTITVAGDKVIFREDIYNRDRKHMAALDKPFKLHLPDLPHSTQVMLRNGVRSASRQSAKFLGPDPEIIGDPAPDRYGPIIDVQKGTLYFD
jgi:murein L,D-transpeptidase YcbB/YkuD